MGSGFFLREGRRLLIRSTSFDDPPQSPYHCRGRFISCAWLHNFKSNPWAIIEVSDRKLEVTSGQCEHEAENHPISS